MQTARLALGDIGLDDHGLDADGLNLEGRFSRSPPSVFAGEAEIALDANRDNLLRFRDTTKDGFQA